MDRAEKSELVTHLNGVFANAGVVVVAHYSGLTVNQMSDLRSRMAKAGASFKVTKNRLAKLALDGTPMTEISDLFAGPTAIAYSWLLYASDAADDSLRVESGGRRLM